MIEIRMEKTDTERGRMHLKGMVLWEQEAAFKPPTIKKKIALKKPVVMFQSTPNRYLWLGIFVC